MALHSSTLAWEIPWMEEPGRLQSMGSLRVGHDWATSLSLFTFMHWRRKWQPTPVFLPWRIPGMGEPGGLPSMGSHRVGHDWCDLAAAAELLSEVQRNWAFFFFFCKFYFLFTTFGTWDLSSLTRDWTHTPCIGSVASLALDSQRSPRNWA